METQSDGWTKSINRIGKYKLNEMDNELDSSGLTSFEHVSLMQLQSLEATLKDDRSSQSGGLCLFPLTTTFEINKNKLNATFPKLKLPSSGYEQCLERLS